MKSLVISVILLLGHICYAQEVSHEFDLSQCLDYAMNNSSESKKYELARLKSEAQLKIEKSKYLPQVAAYTDYQQFIEVPTFIFPGTEGEVLSSGSADGPYPVRIGQEFNLFAGARISQTVFDKRWFNARQSMDLGAEMLRLRERSAREELILGISTVFYEIQKYRQQQILIKDNIDRLQEVLSVLELQYENGVLRKSELQKMQLNLNRLKTRQDRIAGAVRLKTESLKSLMGMPEEEVLSVRSGGINLDELINRNNKNASVEMAIFENRIRAGELSIKSVSDSYFPTVRAFADVQFQAQRNAFNFISSEKWYPRHVVGVGIVFPVFTGFEKKARLQLEEIKSEELVLDKQIAENKQRLNIDNLANQLTLSEQVVGNEKANMELAEQLYQQVLMEYTEGATPVSDLILASIQKIEATNLYEEAVFDYKLSQIKYLRASSGLSILLP